MAELRKTIGTNLAQLRKSKKMTQIELAEHFGYSDKAVSKWENGDALPEIETLFALCEFYGVTIDYLTHEGNIEDKLEYLTKSDRKRIINNSLIETLIVSFIWILATIIYIYLVIFSNIYYWEVFVWAIPASALICLLFCRVWKSRLYAFVTSSVLAWTLITAFYVAFREFNPWLLFILGVPIQIALVLGLTIKGKLIIKK